jgi:adenylate kinase family enzyme
MEKIVIIGSPGAGKSTFARKLGSIFNIRVIHLDRIFWQPGWKEKPLDTRIDILEKIVREKQWIIEGTYLGSSEPRLNAADTIIFLDIGSVMCLQRIIKRHREYRGCSRRDIPEGCKDKPNLVRILKVLAFPVRGKRTLKQKLPYYESMSKEIIWLHSEKEVESFLARLEPQVNEKEKFSKTRSVAGKRPLATV